MEKDNIRFAERREPRILLALVPAHLSLSGQDALAFALPLMERAGGFMVAMPIDVFTDDVLISGKMAEDDAEVGPSLRTTTLLVEEDEDGSERVTGLEVEFLLIDLADTTLSWFAEYDPVTDSHKDIVGFSLERPDCIPEVASALKLAKEWAAETDAVRANFYSAREEQDVPITAKAKAKKAPLAKRNTVASLADQVSVLSAQMQSMMSVMQELIPKSSSATPAPEPALSRRELEVPAMPPLGGTRSAPPVLATPKNLAGLVGPPPKVKWDLGKEAPQGLPDEPHDPFAPHQDPVVSALSQQSQALTSLVAHLTSHSGDPMTDLALGQSGQASASTRGVARRERMIATLAAGTSNFWLQFQQQMARRLYPSRPVPKSEEEIRDLSVSMYTYLERFGGYKGQRDLGLITWIVAAAVDAAANQNFPAVKEHLALLVCSLEQSAIDGSWDTAYLISLAPDPPQQLFQDRMSSMSGLRVFAPIMPGEWAAVHLSYLKELDLLMTKKSELRKGVRAEAKAAADAGQETGSPRRKNRFPKKPKAPPVEGE